MCVPLLAGILSVAAGPATTALASSPPGSGVPHGPGLSMLLTPPRLIIPASGVEQTQRLEIENRGSITLNVHVGLDELTQTKNGASVVVPEGPYSAAHWITVVPDHLSVPSATRRYVMVHIRVPPHPEPGDQDLAITFVLPPRAGHGNIHIAEAIGVPTVITVPGPVIDHVSVSGLTAPGFSDGGPITLAATVRESGDVHHSFTGPHNLLTARAGQATILFPPLTVLRGSTVTFTTKWAHPPIMCVCHLSTTVVSGGRRSVAIATVVIFPVVQVGAGIVVVIALLIAFLIFRWVKRRRLTAQENPG
ncbi:MAG: hypothetical protein ABSF03_16735 [Streptosporangiaceae bacterium]|jgi:hypothetical protein